MDGILRNKVLSSLIIVCAGVVYGLYDYLEYQDLEISRQEGEIRALEDSINSIGADVKRVKEFASNIPAVKQSFREQSLQLESVLESIPRGFELNQLLQLCNQIAQNSGVELLRFRPEVESNGKDPNKSNSYFKTATINLNLKGGFIPAMIFLDQMTKIKRMLSFQEIRLIAKREQKDDKANSKLVSLDITVTMQAYSLGET